MSNGQEMFTLDELQGFLDKLVAARFFTSTPAEADVALAGSNHEVCVFQDTPTLQLVHISHSSMSPIARRRRVPILERYYSVAMRHVACTCRPMYRACKSKAVCPRRRAVDASEVLRLVAAINAATTAHNPTGKAGGSVLSIAVKDLYDAVNRSVP